MNAFDTLKERGFVFQTSNDARVRRLLSQPPATIYEGFDPSAPSLHLGHLISIMAMHHLQKAGHQIIFLLGGGTGRVGDPTGKNTARKLLTSAKVATNAAKLRAQVEGTGLLRFSGENTALMLNNDEWLSGFSFLEDFMMKLAKVFSVNEMVRMRTFADRLEAEQNLSLMEFCYPVLQAWDFLVLFEKFDCQLQIGGQDQWANILQGIDLIRRCHKKSASALTFPLLTSPSGEKMGKTAEGPVWLDAKKTSPFDFYQYLVRTPDSMVPQLLKLFTFLPLGEIQRIARNPREAQKRLAFEVTKIVHGEGAARKAGEDAERLFGSRSGATESVPVFTLPKEGLPLDEILTQAGALRSKSEVRRRCNGGAIRIDDKKVSDHQTIVSRPCLIRFGKQGFLKVETA